ncbi:hypothetical protein WQE_13721 [Paraburkholderia hospita]|uniref:Restriction endonuclease type IV Mrr domain-containing protein n=1 Tax=Paraburkholderia hospita TaxID=169430 RepID=A0ABN0FNS7_9BURK|nr:restriction endonuclease [Paraburkholderia hospita]EIN00475.1 hypothetical protein WQE_13721 [Paraburkholderia hospita]OUL68190.1 hypothetical protein CA602_51795 [Paraburkholderia hospita]
MTSPSAVEIPRPADWQQFERLSRAVFSEVFGARFTRFGRSGQRQNGIDIIGRLDYGKVIAVQCKGRSTSVGKSLTRDQIDATIIKAETYSGHVDEFYIVTTAAVDVTLQKYVLTLSEARRTAGKFRVSLWGWQSLEDEIRNCPRVLQAFYGEWWRKPSLKFSLCIILATTVIGAAGYIGSQRVDQWFVQRDVNRGKTVDGLQQVVSTLDELQGAYSKCVSSMGGKAFVFSGQLTENCTKPIDVPLSRLAQRRNQMAGIMNTDAYAEVVAADNYLNEDFRQLLVAVSMAQHLERDAVGYGKSACPNPKYRVTRSEAEARAFRKSGEDALAYQMAQYYRMRDFALPAISALKARLAIASRLQNGQGATDDLVSKAKSLPTLLQQERTFTYKLPGSPFATARVKESTTRTFTASGLSNDPVDELVWYQTARTAMFEGLRGNDGDVEYLISCGLLKPAARILEADEEPKPAS